MTFGNFRGTMRACHRPGGCMPEQHTNIDPNRARMLLGISTEIAIKSGVKTEDIREELRNSFRNVGRDYQELERLEKTTR